RPEGRHGVRGTQYAVPSTEYRGRRNKDRRLTKEDGRRGGWARALRLLIISLLGIPHLVLSTQYSVLGPQHAALRAAPTRPGWGTVSRPCPCRRPQVSSTAGRPSVRPRGT